MIRVQALTAARAQRAARVLPNGQEVRVASLFLASAEAPEQPMALCVEQEPCGTIPSHFHTVNQFQVVIEGEGTLGKRPLQPWSVHYTNGYTGYGPLCAGPAGMTFVSLRNRFDAGALYFPAGQSFMKPAPKRHYLAAPLLRHSAAALQRLPQTTCEPLLAPEDDGLAAWWLRLGPHMELSAPDPAQGGGHYLLVAGGSLLHDGVAWNPLTCLYVAADTGPYRLRSAAEGLEVLLLQFPRREAYEAQTARRARPAGQAHGVPAPAARSRTSGGGARPALANPEHVALVRQGASAIAAWRAAHPGERLHLAQADLAGLDLRAADLREARLFEACCDGADLRGANLQRADLRAASLLEADLSAAQLQAASLVRANLSGARLPRACLVQAHLHGAHLYGADLQEANLQRAYLVSTELVRADLRGAVLQQADLQWANLQQADLRGTCLQAANLRESVLGATHFGQTMLHQAQGLESCRHQAPSRLDRATLACSGPLPAVFLRGCGWSEARRASGLRADA
ncbi:MAG: pentapeptide repeat-containing protein [Candidatus Tectimicrobiota bacterium]